MRRGLCIIIIALLLVGCGASAPASRTQSPSKQPFNGKDAMWCTTFIPNIKPATVHVHITNWSRGEADGTRENGDAWYTESVTVVCNTTLSPWQVELTTIEDAR